jgi:predicted ATP-dependent serine protease
MPTSPIPANQIPVPPRDNSSLLACGANVTSISTATNWNGLHEPSVTCGALDFRQHDLYTIAQLKARNSTRNRLGYLIEGLFSQQALALVVGDSNLGKSPLLLQAAICIAAGIPFLGHETAQGRVLFIDGENGTEEVVTLAERLSAFLGPFQSTRRSIFLESQ